MQATVGESAESASNVDLLLRRRKRIMMDLAAAGLIPLTRTAMAHNVEQGEPA